MYDTLLTVHSILRWLVIASALAALAATLRGAATAGNRGPRVAAFTFATLFDVQLIVGLLLYLRFSPLTTTAVHHFDRAMGNEVLRFWAVEHPIGMIVGLSLAHLGNLKVRRGHGDPRALRRAAIYFALALIVTLLSVPWPFMPYGRPLL